MIFSKTTVSIDKLIELAQFKRRSIAILCGTNEDAIKTRKEIYRKCPGAAYDPDSLRIYLPNETRISFYIGDDIALFVKESQ